MKHQNKAIIVIFFLPFSNASIVDFEQINISWDMSTNRRLVKDDGRRTHSKCCSSKEDKEWHSFVGDTYFSADAFHIRVLLLLTAW